MVRRHRDDPVNGAVRSVHIEALRRDLVFEAGELLSASHADYPAFRHLIPDPDRRRRMLRIFMSTAARDATMYAQPKAAYDNNGLAGVALWMPPGNFPLSAKRKARMMPGFLRAALTARSSFPALARVGAILEKSYPDASSWYLQALGVLPRVQRCGFGKKLLAPVLDLADGAGLPCHLHTSDPANINYYRRFGFEVSQPAIEVFANGPHYIGMTRPPHV